MRFCCDVISAKLGRQFIAVAKKTSWQFLYCPHRSNNSSNSKVFNTTWNRMHFIAKMMPNVQLLCPSSAFIDRGTGLNFQWPLTSSVQLIILRSLATEIYADERAQKDHGLLNPSCSPLFFIFFSNTAVQRLAQRTVSDESLG